MTHRKILSMFSVLLGVSILLSACGALPAAQEAAPSQAPSQAPAATPEQAPAEAPDAAQLSANPWQWVAFTNPEEQYAIENPSAYVLTFNPDGTLNIQADCNTALGSYTTEGSSLKIELGPMTLAACPEGSRSDDFVKYLGFAAIYFFQDGDLFIDMFADGGTLQLAPAGPPAPAAESAPASTPDVALLTANPWQWVAFINPMEQYGIENPSAYVLTFNPDGTLNIQADCNTALGSYTTEGSSLKIELGPMTLAACPEGSRSDDFIKNLGFAAVYFFQDGDLFIDMFADGGTLQLAPASPTTQASPAVPDAAALVEKLGNLSFTGLLPEQAVTLVDGEFSYDEGASQPATIRLVDHGLPTGDLDGDGLPDAVVLLRLNTSGTGNFTYAAAVLDAFGNPVPTETTLLGDRISVKSLGIEGGVLTAELIAQGPGDPLCCASWNVRKTFTLQDGRLVELSSKDVSKVSFNDLDGTSWQLVDLNGMAGEPVLPDSPVTLQIGGGQVSGSAGCNMYSAEVSGQPDSPSAMTVGPAATSMMMCEGPNASQEAAYLQRLAGVTSWQYDAGRLVLAYEQEGQTGTLVFEPAE